MECSQKAKIVLSAGATVCMSPEEYHRLRNGSISTEKGEKGQPGPPGIKGDKGDAFNGTNICKTFCDDLHVEVRQLKEEVKQLQALFLSFGGEGLAEESAGMSCKTIKDFWPSSSTGVRWINPSMQPGKAFQIYCDMESFSGGWNLLYSSRDDLSGDNNMQKGTRFTAHITSLDSGDANKKIAFDVFEAIESSNVSYTEVMLSGYKDYSAKSNLVQMYFSKDTGSCPNFSQFLRSKLGSNFGSNCNAYHFYGAEKSSGKPMALSWENQAFVAGAVTNGYAWAREVWNEIDNNGGHILAPFDWSNAEGYYLQTDSAGACHQKGLFHIFIR
ncbi:uncharacterized protein [Oscarella lobularis]